MYIDTSEVRGLCFFFSGLEETPWTKLLSVSHVLLFTVKKNNVILVGYCFIIL